MRLDNFVYTLESLSDVRELLEENGILALSFGVPPDHKWVGERLFRNLTDVFGHPPQVYEFMDNDILFLIALEPLPEQLIQNPYIKVSSDYGYQESLGAVTDDWPFLYLSRRGVPSEYVIAIVGIILISFLMLRRTIPDLRQINLHFLFMGAAFFLLETKSITEMALLFGSTWIVNAVVISAILLMIVFANILVIRYQLKDVRLFYILLIGTLVLNYFVPVSRFLGLSFFWRISMVTITQVIPLFFAGIIFAITFSQTDSIEIALGSNLLGAVLGGITEYVSLAVGIRSLYLLAMIFYVFSALTLPQKISVKWQLPKFRRVKMLK